MVLYTLNVGATDLSRQFPTKNISEIPLENGVTYSLRINSQRPLSLGLATVFVSPGKGKLSFHSALKLAEELAQKGWYVDVVPASWYALPYEPEASEADKSKMMELSRAEPWTSDLESSLDFNNLRDQMTALLSGLQNQSEHIKGFRLVIAEGVSAALLLATPNNNALNQPDAVTLISPFWPSTQINESLAQFTANYPTPVLDITFASSNRFTSSTMLTRRVRANNNFKLDYRQRVIPRLQQRAAIEWVGGEIVGWTRSLGW